MIHIYLRMSIYFAFSDECGNYQPNRSDLYIKKNPYYIRSTILIKASDWRRINEQFLKLKKLHSLPINKEIKWSYIWRIFHDIQNGKKITQKSPYYYLSKFDRDSLLQFVEDSINLLSNVDNKIILNVSSNKGSCNAPLEDFYEMHIQAIMLRIEMELANDPENLCVIFFDPVSQEKSLREIYYKLYKQGKFIKKYYHIKDSINFECSHHSVGIQISDFVAGCFNGFLRNFEQSTILFEKCLLNKIRVSGKGKIIGYGILSVPRDRDVINMVNKKLNNLTENKRKEELYREELYEWQIRELLDLY
jgi:hypothetical protein